MIALWILSLSLGTVSLVFDVVAIRWHIRDRAKRKRVYVSVPDHFLPRDLAEQLIAEIKLKEADDQ